MSVTANLTTNVETITATIVVEDETIIVQVSAAARGPAGEAGEAGAAGAAGPNTVTTATTTNLTGFISGNGTNIAGATAAATTATANTLVLRSAGGGASFAGLNTNSGSYAQIGGENFNVATTTNANLTTTGSGTVIVSGAGGTTISGGTLTFSPSGFAYGAGAASAHRTALGLGISQNVTFSSVNAIYNNGDKVRIETLAYIIGSGARISFRNGPWYTAEDASIVREGTGILSQRSDTNPQESRIYGTYTNASNYRRLALKMSSAGVAQIVAEGVGTGATDNRLEFVTGGVTRMTVAADGSSISMAVGTNRTLTLNQADGLSTNGAIQTTGLVLANGGFSPQGTGTDAQFINRNGLGIIVKAGTTGTGGFVGIGTTSPASKLTVTGGDIEVTDSASGIILKSPDGTRYRVTVSDLGILSAASLP